VKKKRAAFLKAADWEKFATDYAKADDRSCGILFGAYVDNCVTETLLTYVVHKDDCEEHLLKESGPLGSFYARIELLWALGGLDRRVRDDLHLVRRIRNKFAHEMEITSFSEEPIRAWCDSLKLPPGSLNTVTNKLHMALVHPHRFRFIISGAIAAGWLEHHHARQNAKA
jgi:hypothetical protein